MGALTQEQWDALSDEEKELRQDEKPTSAAPDKNISNEELVKKVDDLTKELKSLQNEKQGIYKDLRQERETRQQLEAALGELQKREQKGDFDLESLDDAEYLTAGQVKKIIAQLKNQSIADDTVEAKKRSAINYANDEERMIEATAKASDEFPVPYAEAMEEFQKMAKKNPAFWRTVHEESLQANGHPAEVAYRIALTSKAFMSKIRASTRQEILDNLEKEGQLKPKKLPPSGPGKTEINAANLSEEDLLNMSDAQLDQLLEATG